MKTEQNIEELFVNQSNKNNELAAAITLYRYQCEAKCIEEEIEANKPISTMTSNKIKRTLINGTVNKYRNKKTQDLQELEKHCQDNISKLKEKCAAEKIHLPTQISEARLKEMAAETFEHDEFGLQRNCFILTQVLPSNEEENNFLFGDASWDNVSEVLYGDASKIGQIEEAFRHNFKEIAVGNFWQRNKYILIGAGISLALFSVLTPVALGIGAGKSAIVTSCLAQIGHCAPGIIGAGLAKVTGATILCAAILGSGILAGLGINELVKNQKTKELFRQLQPDDFAALLAVRATLVELGQANMNSEKFKNELNESLNTLNDFRADAEYVLIVEKSDTDNNKKKIRICNNFVKRLIAIADI